MKTQVLLVIALLITIITAIVFVFPAQALVPEQLRSAPAFSFSCTDTATRIELSEDAAYKAITVWNATCTNGTCTTNATPVFLGGRYYGSADTRVPVTLSTGMPICNVATACIGTFAAYEVSNLECISSNNTQIQVQVLE